MEKTIKQERNSSIEVLRIIAMLFIVISHYSVHGGFDFATITNDTNRILLQIMTLGNLGVDIFVLISGYFIVNSKYSFKKIIKLEGQVVFYSILLYLIFIISGNAEFSIKSTIKATFPTIFQEYWFFTAYIILYIFTPYINMFFKSISRTLFFRFIVTLIIIWSIIPTFTSSDMFGSVVLQFLMFYAIGAYIRLYPNNLLCNKKKNSIILMITCVFLLVFSTIILDIILHKYSTYFYSRQSILIVGLSVALLVIFTRLKISTRKIINIMGQCTFGVYLIHDNNYVRNWLWVDTLNNSQYANSYFMIIHMLVSAAIIFAICIMIELLRKKVIEKPMMSFLDKHYLKIKSSIIKFVKIRKEFLLKI